MRTKGIPFYEFKEGVYEIDEFDCASIFVIVGEKRALVLDTGTGIGDLRWVIENRITHKPYDVVITHNHGDHIGGAGFFDSVWIHEADADWSKLPVSPSLAFRRSYAELIAKREGKNYQYDLYRDIVEWPKEPEIKIMSDGQSFDLGGRNVTVYHCPGHTAGQCTVIDDKSRILFIADACNQNLLLDTEIGDTALDTARIAEKSLLRISGMKNLYDEIYNSHHDFRGFGSPLGKEVLPNAIKCLRTICDGTAEYIEVEDALSAGHEMKRAAVYDNVQISCMGGNF